MRVALRLLAAVLMIALVGLAIAWLAGAFHDKVGEGAPHQPVVTARPVGSAVLAEVRTLRVPRVEQAVGSVRAVHETSVASRLLAAVVEIAVRTGDEVEAGSVVARLDDTALQARVRQSEAGVDSAQAVLERAEMELRRTRSLVAQGAAAQQELDDAQTAQRTASASVQRAARTLDEVVTSLRYATIRAPMAGVVVERNVEPGDTVAPGQTILTLYDPKRMQLVAGVRESLAGGLTVGDSLSVRIDALDLDCEGTISEIVPRADEGSRTFDVKVTGPCPPGVYSGMFGRLLIPRGEEQVLVAPLAAVRGVGQLHLVYVAADDVLRRRVVQLGRRFGTDVEVLSGLRAGEQVALAE